ncbi:MAG: hypothetical protein WCO42_08795 [bacterium]
MTSGYIHLLSAVAAVVFVFNIPFGFWRDSVRKYSLPWILAIHLPIPFIIGLRIVSGLGWHFRTFPVIIGSFFLGQFLGGRLHRVWRRKHDAA